MSETTDPIFENDLGGVEPCKCGGFTLFMGAVSVHFAEEDVPRLEELVARGRSLGDTAKRERAAKKRRRRNDGATGTFH